MRIVTVCGMGVGTSILLKMTTEKALRELGIDADVEASDISVAKGAARGADLVLTSADLAEELGEIPTPVIVITNFNSVPQLVEKLSAHFGS